MLSGNEIVLKTRLTKEQFDVEIVSQIILLKPNQEDIYLPISIEYDNVCRGIAFEAVTPTTRRVNVAIREEDSTRVYTKVVMVSKAISIAEDILLKSKMPNIKKWEDITINSCRP